jgi:hypothetical protein
MWKPNLLSFIQMFKAEFNLQRRVEEKFDQLSWHGLLFSG